jgi:hypothetical protein
MLDRRAFILAASAALAGAPSARADEAPVTLFKVVTTRDDLVIGLTREEIARIGGADVGLVARAIMAEGGLSAWQYAVRQGADGVLRQAPLRRVAVLAASSLRVEPFATPLPVTAP